MAETLYRYGIKLKPKGNHQLQFRKPKLEIGTVATDWSPAPEDPDKDAMELISILQTDFSVVQGEIQAKVWETDIEKATEGVYESITELYSYIDETINGITAEVGNLTYVVDENYQSLIAELANLTIETNNITSTVISLETSIDGIYNPLNLLRHTNDADVDRPYSGYNSESSYVVTYEIFTSDTSDISYWSPPVGNIVFTAVPASGSGQDNYNSAGFHWTIDNNNLSDNVDKLVEGNTYTFSFYISSNVEDTLYIWFDRMVYGQTVSRCSLDTSTYSNWGQYGIIETDGNVAHWTRVWVTFILDDKNKFRFGPNFGYKNNSYFSVNTYFCGFMLNEGGIANWDDGETAYLATTSYVMSQISQLSDSITATIFDFSNDIYAQIEMLSTSITATVADLENDVYARITELSDSITATVADLENDVYSRIAQISNGISLTVSSKTNGSASIIMTVDGKESGGDLYSSGLRNAFANDTSAITISAGTITFNSNTFIVNSTYFSVTANGTITATAGTIGGWTIGTNALYSGPSSLTSTTNGLCLYSGSNGGLRVNYGDDGSLLRYGYLIFYRSSSERAYISGNSYYTSTGVFGLRLAGYGIIAMMTPYLMSCPRYYAHDADATGYVGYSGALSVLTNTGSYVTLTFYNGICCG